MAKDIVCQPGPNRLGRRDKIASLAEFPFSITEQINFNSSHMISSALVDRYPAEDGGRQLNKHEC